ncbi:formin-like protein 18 [Impatiens glandulifera]|uniref:formin-like protein 18 n=1 Tax=Impatiens glandulifera TaxID=253017 RepID=UPI001FB06396|nr:formin-like protein 18 [Impatiens glandulifera]
MTFLRRFFYKKPPDGLLEISERVFVFDSCFTTESLETSRYKIYIQNIVENLQKHFLDASFLVFNFREGEDRSLTSKVLSEYDMNVMDYPRQYEGCPVLKLEMINHFLRSSESWLSLGQLNVLLVHCERGGWPAMAFMLAALLIYTKQYTGEFRTLDMIYKQAPRELLNLVSPLNPLPSQLRYLKYVSRRNVGTTWPPKDRALTVDCIILRSIPNFDREGGCRPIFRIYGLDPFLDTDGIPKNLFSTPKRSKIVRHYKQAECELVKIDINCNVQGDVVLECINTNSDLESEVMMFQVMFNTSFIRSNILMLNRDDIDILWDAKDQFPKDFRAEIIFSEMNAVSSLVATNFPVIEENKDLPIEAFAKVQEIFSNVDWLDPNKDVALNMIQKISILQDRLEDSCSPQNASEKNMLKGPSSEEVKGKPKTKALQQINLLLEKLESTSPRNAISYDMMQETSPGRREEKYKLSTSENNEVSSLLSASKQYFPSSGSCIDMTSMPKMMEAEKLQSALHISTQSDTTSIRMPYNSQSDTASLHDHKKSGTNKFNEQVKRSPPSASSDTVQLVPDLFKDSIISFPPPTKLDPLEQPSNEVSSSINKVPILQAQPSFSPPPLASYHSSISDSLESPSHKHPLTPTCNKKASLLTPHHPPNNPPNLSEHVSLPGSANKTYSNTQLTPPTFSPLLSGVVQSSSPKEQFAILPTLHSPSETELHPTLVKPISILTPALPSSFMELDSSLTTKTTSSPLPVSSPVTSCDSLRADYPPTPHLPVQRSTSLLDPAPHVPLQIASLVTPLPLLPSVMLAPSPLATSTVRVSPLHPASTSIISYTSLLETSEAPAHPLHPPPTIVTSATGPLVTSIVPSPPPPPPLHPASTSIMSATSLLETSTALAHPLDPPPAIVTSDTGSLATTIVPSPPPPPPPPPPPQSSVILAQAPLITSAVTAPPPPPPPLVIVSAPGPPEISVGYAPPPPPPPPVIVSASGSPEMSAVPAPPPPPISISGNPISKDSPPVAPLPPPPNSGISGVSSVPPPVPGPPLSLKGKLPLRSSSKNQAQPRKNLKPYHWLKLSRAVQGSLWAEAQKPEDASSAPAIDMSELENLFSASTSNSDNAGGRSSRGASGPKSEKVHLIELRRAYNCEIMLTKVKVPIPELMISVLALDDSALDADQVDNLIKFCPAKEEIELLKNYNGEMENLGKCEQFFLELMKVPRVESKLRVFSFKIQFHNQASDIRSCLNLVNSTVEEIKNSDKLKRIMQTILSLGNALNHGTARGSAIGFRLDSLLKLIDTRARNNKMTLMHYLCKVVAEKLPELLEFPKDLLSLEASTKVQLKHLAEEMQAVTKGLEKVVQELSASENDGLVCEDFCKTLKEFLGFAEAEVRFLASLYSVVGKNADALALYFGEDPTKIPFEQVVATLLNFMRTFQRAHDENCKQIEVEKKKVEKETENEKKKSSNKKKIKKKVCKEKVKDSSNKMKN